jgi:hypothetical protein
MGGTGNQLEKFYGELFEWKTKSNNPMKYGVVDTGGGSGGIHSGVGASLGAATGFRYTSTFRQLWITGSNSVVRRSCRQLKCQVVPSWPCSLTRQGNVTGIFLGKRVG